jgi:Flp pilus assembly protein TadD
MTKVMHILKSVVTAIVLSMLLSAPASAQSETLDQLFTELKQPETTDWQRIETEIWAQWSKSGSDAMDLLLERGRAAMAAGDNAAAIEHLTALVDHAPDFAEGWNARATAYFNAGLYGPSIEDIQRTLALNPRHFGALSGLGMIFEQLGDPKSALEAYRQALAIHPHKPTIIKAVKRLEKQLGGTDL